MWVVQGEGGEEHKLGQTRYKTATIIPLFFALCSRCLRGWPALFHTADVFQLFIKSFQIMMAVGRTLPRFFMKRRGGLGGIVSFSELLLAPTVAPTWFCNGTGRRRRCCGCTKCRGKGEKKEKKKVPRKKKVKRGTKKRSERGEKKNKAYAENRSSSSCCCCCCCCSRWRPSTTFNFVLPSPLFHDIENQRCHVGDQGLTPLWTDRSSSLKLVY